MQTNHLDRILNTLTNLYETCQTQIRHNEKICEDCRKLLKPWPKKSKKKEGDKLDASEQTTDNNKLKKGDVPAHELAEMSLVDKVLAKAERTRNKFSNKPNVQLENKVPPESGQSKSTAAQPVTSTVEKDSKSSTFQAPKSIQSQTKPVMSSGKQNTQTKPASSRQSSASLKSNTVSQSHLNKILGRPTSGRAQGRVGHVPAHVQAPFQTAPVAARRGQRSTSRGASSVPVRPSLSQKTAQINRDRYLAKAKEQTKNLPVSMHGDLTQTNESTRSLPDAIHGETRPADKDVSVDDRLDSSDMCGTELRNHAERKSPEPPCHVSSPSLDAGLAHDVQTMTLESTPKPQVEAEAVEERFMLLTQGRQLSLPPKFNKLMSQNRRLREKLCAVTRQNTVQPPASAEEFINRLQEEMDQESCEDVCNLRKVLCLTHLYEALLGLLEDLPVTPGNNLLDKADWKEVFRWRRKLHLVLIAYTTVEQHYQRLVTGFSFPKFPVEEHAVPRQLTETGEPRSISGLYWLPRYIGTVPLPPAGLRYCSRKQLLQYTTAVHDVQLLLLQRYISTAMTQIVKDLTEMNPNTREFNLVYRAVYSMACHLGQAAPTLVTDTIDDLDDNSSPQPCVNDF